MLFFSSDEIITRDDIVGVHRDITAGLVTKRFTGDNKFESQTNV